MRLSWCVLSTIENALAFRGGGGMKKSCYKEREGKGIKGRGLEKLSFHAFHGH